MIGKKVTRPSFCFIAPINYLDFVRNDTHLVLAHLVDQSDKYANFYKNRSKTDWVLMDNGAFELNTPYNPDKLIDLAHRCGANAIVLPDYPGEKSSVTIAAAEKYIPLFKSEGFQTMFVPQSTIGSTADWIDCYKWGAENPEVDIIGMSILGIPNAFPHIEKSYARVAATAILQHQNIFNNDKHHHYLGLNAGPALEIPSLLNMNALTTIDSSGPIWAGIHGHRYTIEADSFQQVKKLQNPVDFNYPRIDDTVLLDRIQYNITLTNLLFYTEDEIANQ